MDSGKRAKWEEALDECKGRLTEGVECFNSLKYDDVELGGKAEKHLVDKYKQAFKDKVDDVTWPKLRDAILTTSGFMGFVSAANARARGQSEIAVVDVSLAAASAKALCQGRYVMERMLLTLCGG